MLKRKTAKFDLIFTLDSSGGCWMGRLGVFGSLLCKSWLVHQVRGVSNFHHYSTLFYRLLTK